MQITVPKIVPRNWPEISTFIIGENIEVTDKLKDGLVSKINELFRRRKMQLVEGYKEPDFWEKFLYFKSVVDLTKNGEYGRFDPNSSIGLLLAYLDETSDGVKFIRYDTIGIANWHGIDHPLKKLFESARFTDSYITKILFPSLKMPLPAGLRTSGDSKDNPADISADKKYTKYSDLRLLMIYDPTLDHSLNTSLPASSLPFRKPDGIDEHLYLRAKTPHNISSNHHISHYWVHLFGLTYPFTGEQIKEYYWDFLPDRMAIRLANLPSKFIK